MAQFREILRHLFLGRRMIIDAPFHGSDQLPDASRLFVAIYGSWAGKQDAADTVGE
jgi:hypothetical protein